MILEEQLDCALFQFIEDYVWSMAYVNGIWHIHTVDEHFWGKDLRRLLLHIKESL